MSFDFFSGHSKIYAEFRPSYPDELLEFIAAQTKQHHRAWDCGTGNGQVAHDLVKYFDHVDATDISEEQLKNATQHKAITYHLCDAQHTSFKNETFDLITVAQAIHWFDLDRFYKEVERVAKPAAILAAWGYNICSVDKIVDPVLQHYYKNVVGSYWHPRRKLIDESYQTIPFPFDEIPSRKFHIREMWTLDHFIGYLTSWSATQNYIKEHGNNPASEVRTTLESHWSDQTLEVRFPLFMRLGIVRK